MKTVHTLKVAAAVGAFALLASSCGTGEDDAAGPETVQPGSSRSNTEPAESPSPDTDIQEDESGDEVTISGVDDHHVAEAADTSIVCDGGGDIHVEAAAQVTVTGDCEDIEIDVDGATLTAEEVQDLEIDGSDNQVTVDTLRDLEVDGNGNEVEITSIQEEIEVDGSDNTVTYQEGSPQVEDDGSGNSVSGG